MTDTLYIKEQNPAYRPSVFFSNYLNTQKSADFRKTIEAATHENPRLYIL